MHANKHFVILVSFPPAALRPAVWISLMITRMVATRATSMLPRATLPKLNFTRSQNDFEPGQHFRRFQHRPTMLDSDWDQWERALGSGC